MAADTRLLEDEGLKQPQCPHEDPAEIAYPRCTETSLVLAVRAAVTHEECLSGYLRHVLNIFKQSSISIVVRTVLAIVAIAIFVIGLLRFHRCSYEPEIPLFLVLSGAAIILKSFMQVLKFCHGRPADDSGERSTLDTCNDVTSLFLVLWILTGSVWVFGAYRHIVQEYNHMTQQVPEAKEFCNLFVFKTALWFLLSIYCCVCIIFLITLLLSIYYYKRKS